MVWRGKGRARCAEGIQGDSGGHRRRCELASPENSEFNSPYRHVVLRLGLPLELTTINVDKIIMARAHSGWQTRVDIAYRISVSGPRVSMVQDPDYERDALTLAKMRSQVRHILATITHTHEHSNYSLQAHTPVDSPKGAICSTHADNSPTQILTRRDAGLTVGGEGKMYKTRL
jgi:hypothetical protein